MDAKGMNPMSKLDATILNPETLKATSRLYRPLIEKTVDTEVEVGGSLHQPSQKTSFSTKIG